MAAETRGDDRERLINLAIYDFHAAVDRGEAPDPAAWVARHPGLAPELGDYFDDLERLEPRFTPTTDRRFAGRSRGRPTTPKAGDILGDYVLLENLGEGGQGVVWKARPRHSREIVVALKSLRGPAAGDAASVDRLRQRRPRDRPDEAPQHRPDVLFRRGPRALVLHHGTRGGGDRRRPGRVVQGRPALGRRAHGEGRPGDPSRPHPQPGRPPSRPQAGQYPPDAPTGSPRSPISACRRGPGSRIGPIGARGSRRRRGCHGRRLGDVARAGIRGTFPYMSPEMAGGRWSEVSTASDIYGLGAVLYAMITGRPPFRGRDAEETLSLVIGGELESPRRTQPEGRSRAEGRLSEVPRSRPGTALRVGRRAGQRPAPVARSRADPGGRAGRRRATSAILGPSAPAASRLARGRGPGAVDGGLAVSVAGLRAENRREAGRLAGQVDRELRLIRRATQILAQRPEAPRGLRLDPRPTRTEAAGDRVLPEGRHRRRQPVRDRRRQPARQRLRPGARRPAPRRHPARQPLRRPELPGPRLLPGLRRSRGETASRGRVRRAVVPVRERLPVQDRGLDRGSGATGDELLGVLVANFTIGPQLVDLDLRQEAADVAVLCPMDGSDPIRGEESRRPSSALHLRAGPALHRRSGRPADRGGVRSTARLPGGRDARPRRGRAGRRARRLPPGRPDPLDRGDAAALPLAALVAAGIPLTGRARKSRLDRHDLQGARESRPRPAPGGPP